MIKILSRTEQDELHDRYRKSDLFRHWSPILNMMEWKIRELDAITLYREAEVVLQKLRLETEHRDEMIYYIFKQLLADFRNLQDEHGHSMERSIEQAECSAVTVMAIVLMSLMNAVEKGHEGDDFENQPMCVAIVGLLRSHPHFQFLLEDFFRRKKENNGKNVIIASSDPMQETETLRNMGDKSQEEVCEMVAKILELTAGLKTIFGDQWELWKTFCQKICMDKELLDKLKAVSPRQNEWKMNQKMLCNIIGIFRQYLEIDASLNVINERLSNKQLRSYLRNHAAFGSSDSELSKLQHERLKKMLSQKSK